jgi:septal ring factor EnvC (AmiA/AmiB activator)
MNNNINLSYLHNVTNTQTFSLGIYTLISLFGGVFVGAGIVYMFLSAQKDKVKAYQRELERTSVSGINNASRVEVLEAKIKTLEKAFNTVADERTQLEVQIKNLNQEIDNITKNR